MKFILTSLFIVVITLNGICQKETKSDPDSLQTKANHNTTRPNKKSGKTNKDKKKVKKEKKKKSKGDTQLSDGVIFIRKEN